MKTECVERADLPGWDDLLKKWFRILNDWESDGQDAAYWYNERATTSTLAAAVWRCNGFALEEYRCSRLYGKQERLGRADLWFKLAGDTSEYVVEAKQAWPSTPKAMGTRATELLDAASEQLSHDTYEGASKVALVFLALRRKEQPDSTGTFLEPFIEAARKVESEVLAWHFGPRVRALWSERAEAHYPGVIVLAKSTTGR
jgi:hypothetical protein